MKGVLRGRVTRLAVAVAVIASSALGGTVASAAALAASVPACSGPVAPYIYPGAPNVADVMNATGVRCFTVAFVLDRGHCTPSWNGQSALTDGPVAELIRAIRAGGGNVIPSSGGATDQQSLERLCGTAQRLAAAYLGVLGALHTRYLDIDLEGGAEQDAGVRAKVARAIVLVHEQRPGARILMTLPVNDNSLGSATTAVLERTVAARAHVWAWSLMPFDNEGPGANMVREAAAASQRLHALLRQLFPSAEDAALYARQGISAMNGLSDTGEVTGVRAMRRIADDARSLGLGRLTFWSLNRDRPCPGKLSNQCSGVSARALAFTRALANG